MSSPVFVPSGFFVLRTPLLPFDDVLAWADGVSASAACEDASRLESALAADGAHLRARLAAAVARPEVREAIFVGSPSLHESILFWENDPGSDRGRRIERSLVRYFMRMAGRATPFGLFAGCSVGSVGPPTRLRLAGRTGYHRHTRLDMEYLFKLAETVERDSGVRERLTYRPNPALYRGAGRIRYVESRFDGKVRTHHLVAVHPTEHLEEILERASGGVALADLASVLTTRGVTPAEAENYLGDLIDGQLLVSELSPAVTGPEPIAELASGLRTVGSHEASDRLDEVSKRLASIDAAGLGVPSDRYDEISRLLPELPSAIDRSRLFQVDLVATNREASIDSMVIAELERGIEILRRVAPRFDRDSLSHFRSAFEQRYDTAEVPLLEALDGDLGVGLEPNDVMSDPSPLLHGLALSGKSATGRWTERDAYLLRRLHAAVESGQREIALIDRDLEALESPGAPPLPDAVSVFGAIASRSEAGLDRGEFTLFIETVGGPSGANLLGRYCHADSAVHRGVATHLRAEEALRPDAIFAEIVHLPEGRIGNILLRPVLRSHEIAYLGRSGAPKDRQIDAADLRVSIRDGRVVLRSDRLGREVVPRLSSAHNHAASALPVYRFLCAVQYQGTIPGLSWPWGALANAPFLPRVTAGRLVLSLARWELDRDAIAAISVSGTERFRAVQRLRGERGFPRFVAVADGDNELPVDLDNALSVETLVHLVKGRESARVVELFGGPENLVAAGPEGRFVHELIVPFVRTSPLPLANAQEKPAGASKAATIGVRSFPPGTEWSYVKLYGAPASADRVLVDELEPFLRDASGSGAVDRWFFIRYADPEPHLRIRLRGELGRLQAEVRPRLEAISASLLSSGQVWRVQWDTYEREVERYGGPDGIDIAERVFQLDSEAVLAILRLVSGEGGLDARWRLALRGMDMLLNDIGLDAASKLQVVHRAREALFKEFRAGKPSEIAIAERFRQERRALESLLDPAGDPAASLRPGLEVLHRRSALVVPLMSELADCEAAGKLEAPRESVAWSYLHMFANRILRSAHRAQELVLYDFLSRVYESSAARARPRRVSLAQARLAAD